jgi:hypothetical protein
MRPSASYVDHVAEPSKSTPSQINRASTAPVFALVVNFDHTTWTNICQPSLMLNFSMLAFIVTGLLCWGLICLAAVAIVG